MSSPLRWETKRDSTGPVDQTRHSGEVSANNLHSLREAAITLLREVESLTNPHQPNREGKLRLQEEVQRYEIELIRKALLRTRGNQRRAAKLLGVKVSTLNCKIKRFGISVGDDGLDLSVLA